MAKNKLSLGDSPALIVVDMTLGFTSPSSPLGGECDSVIEATASLLKVFRHASWPIFFTSVEYDKPEQASVFRSKLPALELLQKGSQWVTIDPAMAHQQNEPIIKKHGPSGFFGTDLATQLHDKGADCLVVVGLTTSGCVRATCVDGLQHNFPVFVPIEACGDRDLAAQKANLYDLDSKYAQVLSVDSLLIQLSAKQKEIM